MPALVPAAARAELLSMVTDLFLTPPPGLAQCGRILVGLLLAWLVWMSPRRVRRLRAAERRQQLSVSHFMQHVVHTVLLAQQYYQTLLPLLAEAPLVSARDFAPSHQVDCRRNVDGAFAVVALERALFSRLTALATSHFSKWAVDPTAERAALDGLVLALLQRVDAPAYVDARGRARPPLLSDCIYCGLSIERGAPFPMIHTDTEWDLFPTCDGFQVWCLLKADTVCEREANMLLVESAASTGSDPPVAYHFHPDGTVLRTRNQGGDAPAPGTPPTFGRDKEILSTHASLAACGLSFHSLQIEPGECVLMNRHQLHMSDPRPHAAGRTVDRLALTMRVILKPPGASATTELLHAAAPAYTGKVLPRIIK